MWKKAKYSFLHKASKKDEIPPCLPKPIISNYELQREEYIKFLGVLLNQLTWKKHIKLKIKIPKTKIYYIKRDII